MTPITSQQAQAEIGKAKPPSLWTRAWTLEPYREAKKNWKTVPQARVIILLYLARFWFFIWSGWAILGYALGVDARLWLLAMLLAGIITTVGLFIFKGTRPGFAFLSLAAIWLILVAISCFTSGSWLVIWGIGSLLLLGIFAGSLFLPFWTLEVGQNDVYITEDKTYHNEGFMLKSRSGPTIDAQLRDKLIDAGVPPDSLNRFLKFGAPRFMEAELKEKLKAGSEPLFNQLWAQVDDPKHRAINIIHVAAMDRVWLLWDKGRKMTVNIRLDQVITEGGSPVNIQLQFDFAFDPETIRAPEFRLLLNKWKSMDDLETVLKGAMEGAARKEVKLHFVNIPLDSALTKGSIERFREVLAAKFSWSKDQLGIVVRADNIQCTPLIHETVQEAETKMIAARAQAQADLARMKELLNHVILGGVPPKLLAGLMMMDQGVDTMSLTHRGDDMLNLPDADDTQRFLFYKNKYGFPPTPPSDALPASVSPKPAPEPPPQSPEPPHKPDYPTPGNRRGVNIKKLLARRDTDGVFRPDSDGN